MEKKLKRIIDNYGVIPQLKYFQTEVFELNEAIIKERNTNYFDKAENYIEDVNHIAEEIADVMVMLEQFKIYYNIKDMDIEEVMDKKINRQVNRIEKGIKENIKGE